MDRTHDDRNAGAAEPQDRPDPGARDPSEGPRVGADPGGPRVGTVDPAAKTQPAEGGRDEVDA
jgi:hypothetical protein